MSFPRNEANGRWTIQLTRGLIYRRNLRLHRIDQFGLARLVRIRNLYIEATHSRRTHVLDLGGTCTRKCSGLRLGQA